MIVRAARLDLSTWSAVYSPGVGSAANVVPVPGDDDKMIFFGNFGTDVTVVLHTISTGVNSDISPAGLGAKVVNTCAVNPGDANQMAITVDTDQDVLFTNDGGSNWSTWEAALGMNATAFYVLWSIAAWAVHRAMVAGHDGMDEILLYTPNQFGSETDVVGSLSTVANIVSIEVAQ